MKLMSPDEARKLDFWLQCYMCKTFYTNDDGTEDYDLFYIMGYSEDGDLSDLEEQLKSALGDAEFVPLYQPASK